VDKELVSSNEYDEFVAKLTPEEQAERGWVIRSNASEIRTHKYETILEMWEDGWMYNDYGEVVDEIRGLHTGEKPLWQFDDDELNAEYERALAWKKEQE
tara:strand:+ start:1638 stop:1934 length:297 start_codon:yes stop_codon:yes gene_type:complete